MDTPKTETADEQFAASKCWAALPWSALPARAGWYVRLAERGGAEPEIIEIHIGERGQAKSFDRIVTWNWKNVRSEKEVWWAGPIEFRSAPHAQPPPNDQAQRRVEETS